MIRAAKEEHKVIYAELAALVSRHAAGVSPDEILAIAANMVGKLIALQDQRTMSIERAMETVRVNIEVGNREAVEKLVDDTAGNA